jgi:hypothetical protein
LAGTSPTAPRALRRLRQSSFWSSCSFRVRERQAANPGRGLVKVDDVQRTASGGLREARGRYAKLSPATAALVAEAQQARQGLFDGDSGRCERGSHLRSLVSAAELLTDGRRPAAAANSAKL